MNSKTFWEMNKMCDCGLEQKIQNRINELNDVGEDPCIAYELKQLLSPNYKPEPAVPISKIKTLIESWKKSREQVANHRATEAEHYIYGVFLNNLKDLLPKTVEGEER